MTPPIYLTAQVFFDNKKVLNGAILQGSEGLPFLLAGSTTADWKVDIRCGLANNDSREVGLGKDGRLPPGFRLVVHFGNGKMVSAKHLKD